MPSRNAIWPLKRTGKGWERAQDSERLEAALLHLVRTPRGSLYHDPDYGTLLHHLRGQPVTDEVAEAVAEDVERQILSRIPGVTLEGVDLGTARLEKEERLAILIRWSTNEPRTPFEAPRKTRETIVPI